MDLRELKVKFQSLSDQLFPDIPVAVKNRHERMIQYMDSVLPKLISNYKAQFTGLCNELFVKVESLNSENETLKNKLSQMEKRLLSRTEFVHLSKEEIQQKINDKEVILRSASNSLSFEDLQGIKQDLKQLRKELKTR